LGQSLREREVNKNNEITTRKGEAGRVWEHSSLPQRGGEGSNLPYVTRKGARGIGFAFSVVTFIGSFPTTIQVGISMMTA
jgi:hypothetical protein